MTNANGREALGVPGFPASRRCAFALAVLSAAACHRDPPAPRAASAPAVAEVNPVPRAAPPGDAGNGFVARIPVTVDATGYHPDVIHVHAGEPVVLLFTRTSDEGCGQQVVFPTLDLRRDLPLNREVAVTVTPSVGTLAFTCGMNMYRGSIVAMAQ